MTTKKAKAIPARLKRSPDEGVGAQSVSAPASAPGAGMRLTDEQIRAAFSGKIEQVRPTPMYRLWIAVVAAVMVLLPLIYVGIIGLVAVGLAYHATHHYTVFQSFGSGRHAVQAAAAVYLGPLVIGGVVVLFMLKPFFARPARREKQRVLERTEEPLLHTLVDGVCAAVGSPRPTRIEVNCAVNASAHREGSFLGLFGNRLVLTIGLPLAAGLTLKQFTGVLAHEFGHFSQGAGMRLCTLIRTVNMWFARVVYERDAWDQRLEEYSQYDHLCVKVLGGLTRLAVWLTRRVLWVLMWAAHLVSSFLSRQMEFDADCYEARMVGGHVFADTMWRIRVMSLAQNGAYSDLGSSWREQRLPDDFPKLVLANVPQIPEEIIEKVRADVEKTETGWLESHPCDRDRSAHAMAEAPGEGIFRLEGPSSAVFSDIGALSREVSLDHYRSIVDRQITSTQLFSVADLLETQAYDKESFTAANRFFLESLNMTTLTLSLPSNLAAPPEEQPISKEAIVEARNELLAARPAYVEASQRILEAKSRLFALEYAALGLRSGLKISLAGQDAQVTTSDEAAAARNRVRLELGSMGEEAAPFCAAAARRLALAVFALADQDVVDRIPDGRERRDEARILYPCVAHLGRIYACCIERVACQRTVMMSVVNAFQADKNPHHPAYTKAFHAAAESLATALVECRAALGQEIEYPFEHAEQNVTLGTYMLAGPLPGNDNPGGLLEAADAGVNRIDALYGRCLGRLAMTAETVEESFGLPPLEIAEPQPASDGQKPASANP
jgi:Zn-dependent protease with chaperone function